MAADGSNAEGAGVQGIGVEERVMYVATREPLISHARIVHDHLSEREQPTVRGELQKALACLDGDDVPDSRRVREAVARYTRRALLLLTGTSADRIFG